MIGYEQKLLSSIRLWQKARKTSFTFSSFFKKKEKTEPQQIIGCVVAYRYP
jgi:hypothetical protein